MPSAVIRSGKWRIKPSGKMPIYIRFVINSAFTKVNAKKAGLKSTLSNRTYLNHMMYWPASEYDKFEKEIISHLKRNNGWYENFIKIQLRRSEVLYRQGLKFKKVDWRKKTNEQIKSILCSIISEYQELICAWYTQYPLDEYFEDKIESELTHYIKADDPAFRKYILIFTDPHTMTEVSEERWLLLNLVKLFNKKGEKFNKLSREAKNKIKKHLDKFAYINRGLATSEPYTFKDIVGRMKEVTKQIKKGESIDELVYFASQKKVKGEFKWALNKINPNKKFRALVNQARDHSYLRNRRVEAWFNADYGASFMYKEIARRAKFNPKWIMEVSVPEMIGSLTGKSLPSKVEMQKRFRNYAMVVRNAETKLITDLAKIKKMEKQYFVDVDEVDEIQGKMACLGGIIRGKAKVCLDKKDISKVKTGDILIAQFTTPDFVPAMEKAAAIVADQGGLSSHAAIVSRELSVPCVIATSTATRVIHDNDLLEIDARKGIVKVIKRARKS